MRSIVGGATRAAPPQVQPRLDLQVALTSAPPTVDLVGDLNVKSQN